MCSNSYTVYVWNVATMCLHMSYVGAYIVCHGVVQHCRSSYNMYAILVVYVLCCVCVAITVPCTLMLLLIVHTKVSDLSDQSHYR